MKLRTALIAAALGAVASGTARSDDGLPLPHPPQTIPAQIATLESDSRVLTMKIASDRKELDKVERNLSIIDKLTNGPGYVLLVAPLDESIQGDAKKLTAEIAALGSSEAVITSEIAALEAEEVRAAEEARAAAERKAAEERAAAEQAALSARIDKAISNAANAWRSDGIVNRNTGDHSWDMWCLALASTAWETALGAQVPDLQGGSAWESAQKWIRDGRMHTGGVPPRGALVYWPAEGHGGFGHVAISNGDGTVVSNYTRAVVATGINPHAAITDFGPIVGWVDPRDIHP